MALTNAEKQRRWRIKQKALVRDAKRLRGAPVLDEDTLICNMVRLSEGDGPVALRATMFLLTHKVWLAPPKPAAPLGKKEQAQIDAEEGHEGTEWSDILLQ